MEVFVLDHTLFFQIHQKAWFIRLCRSLDGKFSRKKDEGPFKWFKIYRWRTGNTNWKIFTIPYIAVGSTTYAPVD